MKIAIVTLDGETVSQHFGRSPYFKIYTIENNKIVNTELRERGTGHFAAHRQHAHTSETDTGHSSGRHGYGADADQKHFSMAQEIGDCDVLIAGGMGQGAYESFRRAGLEVILTDQIMINDIVRDFMNGNLKNLAYERTD
ncbi:MAG: hypothetical protein J7K46_03685 [Bacteroidales bacterium]|nr:hypothetical protein [Bacteroidales bacterium]